MDGRDVAKLLGIEEKKSPDADEDSTDKANPEEAPAKSIEGISGIGR